MHVCTYMLEIYKHVSKLGVSNRVGLSDIGSVLDPISNNWVRNLHIPNCQKNIIPEHIELDFGYPTRLLTRKFI